MMASKSYTKSLRCACAFKYGSKTFGGVGSIMQGGGGEGLFGATKPAAP